MPTTQFTQQHNPQARSTAAASMLVCATSEKIVSCKSSSFLKLSSYISFLWKTLRANGKNCKNVSFSKCFTIMKMRKESWVELDLPYFHSQTLLYNSGR